MDPAELHHRLAARGDRSALSAFTCTSADPRPESWIRDEALDRQLTSPANDDFRLLVFHQDDGELIAVIAHERNFFVVVDGDPDPVPGSYLMVAAIADRFRDGMAPDGRRLISAVLEAALHPTR